MSGISRRVHGGAALAAVMMVSVLAMGMSGSARAEPSTADIQWAQTILKEKGYDIGGRAKGQMTPETRNALRTYQKSAGLPVTGNLDQATVSRMMGEREQKAAPTMGSLSKSQVGQTRRDKEVVPRAAPTGRVDAGNESVGGMAQFGGAPVSSSSSSSSSSPGSHGASAASPAPPPTAAGRPAAGHTASAGEGPAPQAAPRGAVSATTPDGKPAPLEDAAAVGAAPSIWQSNAARAGVAGLIAATLGGIGFAWWRSGRGVDPLSRAPAGDDRPRESRIEPSFGSPRRREELTPGPRLTAEARRR
ncbi:peptidoglycan-binding domain-containing protein [Azospirillum sp. HJ39]|uniref:peptidoglycan-binding domain-containing protein n=1 Tax=Azospirillum sp. HJ39 TaxID=3159496 RepID=UPI003555CCFA